MREESGRSLIEMIGVLAISAIIVSATFAMYRTINQSMRRMIASEKLQDIASKTKTLLEYSGYNSVSVDFLIKSGALDSDRAPAGNDNWSVTSSADGMEFYINLTGLSYNECSYFATKKFDWAHEISVNEYKSSSAAFCLETGDNKISFSVK